MRWLTLSLTAVFVMFCSSAPAAIIVDPKNVGATDVHVDFVSDPPLVARVGLSAHGELLIDDGSVARGLTTDLRIAQAIGSVGVLTVDGPESVLQVRGVWVGGGGNGKLSISNAGTVEHFNTVPIYIGGPGQGYIEVDGLGSTFSDPVLHVRVGILTITDGGLVSPRLLYTGADGFVNMATGGMLALSGEAAGSISEFLDLVEGTDAIRYWDTSLPGWAPITIATEGTDYTLEYLTTGDLAGYTKLTVFTPIPEPMTWMLLAMFALAMMVHYRLVRS